MFANTINDFLFENALYLAITFASLIFVIILVYIILGRNKNKPVQMTYDALIAGLGGVTNIITTSGRGSRLSVRLKDYQIIQQEQLKTHGVESLIQMSQKITLLIAHAEHVAEWMNEQINKK